MMTGTVSKRSRSLAPSRRPIKKYLNAREEKLDKIGHKSRERLLESLGIAKVETNEYGQNN